MEWIRKIYELPPNILKNARIRNEYIQYLKIQLSSDPVFLMRPFKNRPLSSSDLVPLPEALGNIVADDCPFLQKTGMHSTFFLNTYIIP